METLKGNRGQQYGPKIVIDCEEDGQDESGSEPSPGQLHRNAGRSISSAVPENFHLVSAADNDAEVESVISSMGGVRPDPSDDTEPNERKDSKAASMALYDDEPGIPLVASYFRGFIVPGPTDIEQSERDEKKQKKANFGVMLGVYLPTVQNLFGITLFLRLYWIVGIMGLWQSCGMVLLCCLCTLLTAVSMSAIVSNGVVEGGGPYFIISRNLGPEIGTAIGVQIFLANAVATSMYLVGGVEIILIYIFPSWTIGGPEVHQDTGLTGMMTHNVRIYSTIILLIVTITVAFGVKFVQLFAPVALIGVILSILAIYAGSIQKAINPESGQSVCMLNDQLLQSRLFLPSHAPASDICKYCTRNVSLAPQLTASYCTNSTCDKAFTNGTLRCVNGFPGFSSGVLFENLNSAYAAEGESYPGVKADSSRETYQDLSTSFYVLLAIFFPAVTDIMAGSNLSGDLKNPQKSIPSGTIGAHLTSSFVFLTFCVIMGGSIIGPLLRDKYGQSLGGGMVVAELAWPSPWVLLIGSFLSVFGAALQCMCSAPRLLQSLAKDDVIPFLRPFSVVNKHNEPIRGLILSAVVAEIAILYGGIDQISPVVDFFFLICYTFINLSCALHSLLGAPNWRPRFKYYHWSLSLMGALVCFFIMFSTHWYFALITLGICLGIYKYVEWKGAKKEWGDGIRGLALSTAQYSLMKVEDEDPHVKNWRPQLLILTRESAPEQLHPENTMKMLRIASQLKSGKGLSIVVAFVEGDATKSEDRLNAKQVKRRLKQKMEEARLRGFAKTMVHDKEKLTDSVETLLQCIGIGGLQPNTVMLAWPSWKKHDGNEAEYWSFLDNIHRGAAMDMSVIVMKGLDNFAEPNVRLSGSIDVWWVLHDGGLLLLISFLLKQRKTWRGCHLRLFTVAQVHDNSVKMKEDLQTFLYQMRIDASVMVVELTDQEISAYVYERTLQMEDRAKLVNDLHLTSSEQRSMPHIVVEDSRGTKVEAIEMSAQNLLTIPRETRGKRSIQREISDSSDRSESSHSKVNTAFEGDDGTMDMGAGAEMLTSGSEGSAQSTVNNKAQLSYEYTFTPPNSQTPKTSTEQRAERIKKLDREKVKKMHTAVRLNQKLREHSESSQLVIINLPRPPRTRAGLHSYLEYLETLTEGLPRLLLVRGTGKEVITMY
uniref:Solute carrier family 12 member 6 n=1 Tax=Plectus sambesii TaxID=2011161 RepID=A0A914VHW9_9BILA